MKTKQNKICTAFIIFYTIFFAALVAVGSFYDLELDKTLFNPNNPFAHFFEIWGEVPRFAMWAPAATILLLSRHSLAECLEIINRLFPFIPTVSENALDKVIRNVGKYYVDLSKGIWYIISAVVAVLFILVCSRIPKSVLNKLEPLALMGILIGLFYCSLDSIKGAVNRVRFREMVAFSNGFENAKDTGITHTLVGSTDFSQFTQWYQKGNGGTMLNGFELGGESCPSGHVLSGTFTLLLPLLCSRFEKLRKLTIPACFLSFLYIASLGLTRMIRGAHFLSDISLGALLGMAFFLIAYGVLKFLESKKVLPARKMEF